MRKSQIVLRLMKTFNFFKWGDYFLKKKFNCKHEYLTRGESCLVGEMEKRGKVSFNKIL